MKASFYILKFHFLKEVSHECIFPIVLCKYWNGCVLEWLYQGCDSDLSAEFLFFGVSDFPFKFLLSSASKSFFFALASSEIRFLSCNF